MSRNDKIILNEFIISGIIAIAMFCWIFFTKGIYSVYGSIDALFAPGILLIMIGSLALCASFGAFDIFSYGFRSIFEHMNPNTEAISKYKDYYDYKKSKRTKREYSKFPTWPFFVVGGLFIIAGIVMEIIYHAI